MPYSSDSSDSDLTNQTPSPAQSSPLTSAGGSKRNSRQEFTSNVRNSRSPPMRLNLQGGRRASALDRRSNARTREHFEREKKLMAVGDQNTRAGKMMEEARSALIKLQAAGKKGSRKEKREAFEANIEVLKTTSKRAKYNGIPTPPPTPGATSSSAVHGADTTQTIRTAMPPTPDTTPTRPIAGTTTRQTAATRTMPAPTAIARRTTASTMTASKGIVAVDSTEPQAPIDWQATIPCPVVTLYEPHPLIDRDDRFFDNEFKNLQSSLLGFARNFIQIPHNLNDESMAEHLLNMGSAWSNVKLPEEFAFWAEQVATGGSQNTDGSENLEDSWDRIMVDGKMRGLLVAGIIWKILGRKVFGDLLFGGRAGEKDMMEQAERESVFREGFSRTAHRAQTVRYVLGESPTSANFYEDVLTLTAEIHELFKPLYEWLFELYPLEIRKPINTEFYQELYQIVEHAAWLSICIRLSPTIFFMVDTSPESYYEADMHRNVDAQYWTNSKNEVWKTYETKLKLWRDEREIARAKVYAHLHAKPKSTRFTKQGKLDVAEFERLEGSKPTPPTNNYRAQCKIAVFPNIKRFKPGSKDDEEREKWHIATGGIPLAEKLGSREHLVLKSAILCHYAPITELTKPISLSSFLSHVHPPQPLYIRAKTGAKYVLTGGLITTVGFAAAVTVLDKTGTLQDLGVYGNFLNSVAYPVFAAKDLFVFVGSEGVRRLNEYATRFKWRDVRPMKAHLSGERLGA